MLNILIFIAFWITVWGVWLSAVIDQEAKGRGWFTRNWIAATVAFFMAVVVLLLLLSENWILISIGIFVCGTAATAPYRNKKALAAEKERRAAITSGLSE